MTTSKDPDGDTVVHCRVPFVIVERSPRGTLRLDDAPGNGLRAADGDALAGLRDQTLRHCDLWTRPLSRFVEHYFDFVSGQVTRHRNELERRLARFGGLYGYRDWVFSAPLPLPRAHLPVPASEDGPARRIRVDVAFWSAGRLVAIALIGSATVTAEQWSDREVLRSAGVEIIEIDEAELAADDALLRLLPADFHAFWRDQPFPTGAFAPDLPPP